MKYAYLQVSIAVLFFISVVMLPMMATAATATVNVSLTPEGLETVTFSTSSLVDVDLTGYSFGDEENNSHFDLSGVIIPAGGSVTFCQTGETCDRPDLGAASVWNDDGDTLFVMQGASAVVSQVYTTGESPVAGSFDVTVPDVPAPVSPVVTEENFNTHSGGDYKGINVGFNIENFGEVTDVEINLYDDSNQVIAKNTDTQLLLDLMNTDPEETYSTPFFIQNLAYGAEPYWNLELNNLTKDNQPDWAEILVTDVNGTTYRAEHHNLSEATVAYVELFPEEFWVSNGGDDGNDGSEGAPFATIQKAVSVANAGAIIHVLNGTYTLTNTLYVEVPNITITGESEAGVIIDASSFATWGIAPQTESGMTLENFTLEGPNHYGIKAFDLEGLTLRNITVNGSGKTEVDLNQVSNSTLENITVNGEGTAGVGIGLSNATNITLSDITTSGNAWGSIGLYDYSTGPTEDVTFAGTYTHDEPVYVIYIDAQYGFGASNITLPDGFDWAVRNAEFRTNGSNFTLYQPSLADAASAALSLQSAPFTPNTVSTIQLVAVDGSLENSFVVSEGMKIQKAVDAAASGATISVLPGTYPENVTVSKELTIIGEDRDTTIVETTGTAFMVTSSATFENLTLNDAGSVATTRGIEVGNGSYDLIISNVLSDGLTTGIYLNPGSSATVTEFEARTNAAGIGIDTDETVTITNSVFSGNTDEGVGVTASGGDHVTISGSEFAGNTFGVRVYDGWPSTYVGTTTFVSAEGNWWGSATGPPHASNAAGTGDAVTDGVDFGSFCTQADCGTPSDDDNDGRSGSRRSSSGGGNNDDDTPPGLVLGASTSILYYNFMVNMGIGTRSDDVVKLQQILINQGYLRITAPTGYFGPLTQAAVQRYQTAHGIPSTGFVGPLTRASLNTIPLPNQIDRAAILAILADLLEQIAEIQEGIDGLND